MQGFTLARLAMDGTLVWKMADETKPPAGPQPADIFGRPTLPLDAFAVVEQKPLQPGQTFADRYKIEALIGQGGAGAIYSAFDEASE